METYHINATSVWETMFHLTKDGDETILGTLIYPKWYSYDAQLEVTDDKRYVLEQTGFWGNSVVLKDDEKILMQCHSNWKGHILIESLLESNLTGYKLKNTFSLNQKVLLLDQNQNEEMIIIPDNRWYESVRKYKITLSEKLAAHPNKKVIMLTAIHCSNRLLMAAE